jgi:hypothetical protein
MNIFFIWLCSLFFSLIQTVYALEQTNRYAGYRLVEIPDHNKKEWGSTFFATMGWAEAKQAYDDHGLRVPLFNDLGPVRLKELAGVAPVGSGIDPDGKSEQEKLAYVTGYLLGLSQDEASVSFGGSYRQLDFVLQAIQNLGSGLFVQVVVPFKKQKIQNIMAEPFLVKEEYKALGLITASEKYDAVVAIIKNEYSKDETVGLVTKTWKASLNRVLVDAGINDVYKDFNSSSVGDVGLYFGWGGEQRFEHSITKYVEGILRLGLLAPVARIALLDQPFSLPFGAEHHWAVVARGEGEIGFFDYCSLGGSLGSCIYFPKKLEQRLSINKDERGWIRLNKGIFRVDQGSLWDANGYLKVFYDPYGLSAWMGISYYAQGTTTFSEPSDMVVFTKEALFNDVRTKGWHHYMLHWGIAFDAKKVSSKKITPLVMCTYDFSLAGERVWKTNLFGGSLGLYCQWEW